LYAYKGKVVSKERLAAEACEIEIDRLKEPIGKQDQYAAAYGNINYIKFNKNETVDVSPILLTETAREKLEDRLCLYYIGGKRKAGDILNEQKKNMLNDEKFQNLRKMVILADELRDALHNEDINSLGGLLYRGWLYKKELASGISNEEIDRLYNKAMEHGASGGKLLGAGGAGFLLIYKNKNVSLKKHLGCKVLPFNIDREGTKIIFYE